MAITVSGTSITFNDATVQTTAATGGVTSLNGQTGAITNTTFDAIGSVGWLVYNGTTNLTAGGTVAGTSLYYASTVVTNYQGAIITNGSIVSGTYTRYNNGATTRKRGTLPPLPTADIPPLGFTALTGTWRAMNAVGFVDKYAICCDGTYNNYNCIVFMRVS
jgi:hypothetical protein